MSLTEVILSFDGKHVAGLKEAAKNTLSPDQVDQLIEFCKSAEPKYHTAATWLILAQLRKENILSDRQKNKLIACLPHLNHWEAKLHILQSLRFLSLSKEDLPVVIRFIRDNAQHQKTFVRVWALDALVHLAHQFPELEEKATKALTEALDAKQASIRARARNLLH